MKKVMAVLIYALDKKIVTKPIVLRLKGNGAENTEEMLGDRL